MFTLMWLLTSGIGHENRIAEIIRTLRDKERSGEERGVAGAFEVLCFCGQFGVQIPVSLLHRLNDDFYRVEERPALHDFVEQADGRLSPVFHASVSRLAADAFAGHGSPPARPLESVVTKIEATVESEQDFLVRLVSAIESSEEPSLARVVSELCPLSPAVEDSIQRCEKATTSISDGIRWFRLNRVRRISAEERGEHSSREGFAAKEKGAAERAVAFAPQSGRECSHLKTLWTFLHDETRALQPVRDFFWRTGEASEALATYLHCHPISGEIRMLAR